MTSGELLKYRNGLLMAQAYHAQRRRQYFVRQRPALFLSRSTALMRSPWLITIWRRKIPARTSTRAGLARITSSKVQSSRWSFANLFVERMANSAFSAISSLHSFVAYSLFQLPRLLLL